MEKNSERRRFVKQYQESVFGEWQNQEVRAYRLENDKGYQLSVMTYGATILEYVTPDKEDQFTNIILGFDRFEDYVGNSPKYGASIGPVAGRIAGASFELNGETYHWKLITVLTATTVDRRAGTVPCLAWSR